MAKRPWIHVRPRWSRSARRAAATAAVLLSLGAAGCTEAVPTLPTEATPRSTVPAHSQPIAVQTPQPARAAMETCVPTGISTASFEVYTALAPHCAGCHSTGDRGYFASAEAFQALLVADAHMVKPGAPDDSELVRLLEGTGTGAFTQMPIGVDTYADLAQRGDASMSMAQIRAWVTALGTQQRHGAPNRDAPRIRRLSATHIKRALYQQLGLDDTDFFTTAHSYGLPLNHAANDQRYPFLAPEDLPAPWKASTRERYTALGGGSVFQQVPPDATYAPSAVLTLTQVAQAWCRLGLEKDGNTALVPAGMALTAEPSAAKALIARWGVHFWGEQLPAAEVDALHDTVFAPLSTASDAMTGYVGVCSTFIRHPKWMFF